MSEFKLGPADNIPPGEGRVYQVADERVAVFRRRGGGVYAVQAECPHRGGPLAGGLLGGSTLICPLHAWKFDLKTGQAMYGDCGLKDFFGECGCVGADYSAAVIDHGSFGIDGATAPSRPRLCKVR